MIICNTCGFGIEDFQSFCRECGAPNPLAPRPVTLTSQVHVGKQSGVSPTPSQGDANPPDASARLFTPALTVPPDSSLPATAPKKKGPGLLIVLLIMISVAAISAAIYFASRGSDSSSDGNVGTTSNALSNLLKKAIDEGRLVTLGNDDAYTYYYRLKSHDPQHEMLSRVPSQVIVKLRSIGEDILSKRLTPQDESIGAPEWEKSFRAFKWAHDLEPVDKRLEARWRYTEGEVALTQGRIEDGERSLFAATQIDTNWALPHNRLGRVHAENKNDFRSAIAAYRRAIAIDPNWEYPYNNMGTAFYNLKDDDNAIQSYEKALQLNPSWARPHYWLGEIYERKGWRCEALREYQTVRSLDSTFRPAVIDRKLKSITCY